MFNAPAKVGASALLRITNWTAWVVAITLALVPPLSYLLVQYTRVTESMRAEAQLHANEVTELVQRDPDHWQLQNARFLAMFARPTTGTPVPELERVIARDGQVVAEKNEMSGHFHTTTRAPTYDAGELVGWVEATRVALLCSACGCLPGPL